MLFYDTLCMFLINSASKIVCEWFKSALKVIYIYFKHDYAKKRQFLGILCQNNTYFGCFYTVLR